MEEQRDGRYLFRRHLSEQYKTSSQTFSHFFRQLNGRPQVLQVFDRREDLLDIWYGEAS